MSARFKSSRSLERELKVLVGSVENANRCGECGSPYPTWCSVNFGVFLCGSCASAHRKVLNGKDGGPESNLKSLTLDRWTVDEFEEIGNSGGNRRNHKIWNFKNQGFPSYADQDKSLVEQFIKDKYIYGKFRAVPLGSGFHNHESDSIRSNYESNESDHGSKYWNSHSRSSRSQSGGASVPSNSVRVPKLTHRTVNDSEIGRYSSELAKIKQLGYSGIDTIVESLVLAKGDINIALDILEDDAKDNSRSSPPFQDSRKSPSPVPVPALFDGFTGVMAPHATQQQLNPQSVFDGSVQQYVSPATAPVYVDQKQYSASLQLPLQQQQLQQLLLQQQQLPLQQLQQQQLQQQQLQQQQLQQQQLQQQQLQQQQLQQQQLQQQLLLQQQQLPLQQLQQHQQLSLQQQNLQQQPTNYQQYSHQSANPTTPFNLGGYYYPM